MTTKNGYSSHRLADNPKERIFLEVFNEEFRYCTHDGLLESLKQNGTGIKFAAISEEEEKIVLTIIQWLGSNVGQGFLDRVQKEIIKEANHG